MKHNVGHECRALFERRGAWSEPAAFRRSAIVALIASMFLPFAGCRKDDAYSVAKQIEALKDSDPDTRCTAAEVLGSYGAEAQEAVPALAEAIRDSDENVRIAALYALAAIGPHSAPAVPGLKEALADKSESIREGAAYALAAVGAPAASALPELQTAMNDSDEAVRDEAREAIRRINLALKYRQ